MDTPETLTSEEDRRAYRAYPYFFSPCLEAFRFLTDGHNFSAPRLQIIGHEGYIEFRKSNQGFEIAHEPSSQVWGTLILYKSDQSSSEAKRIGFHQLMALLDYTPPRSPSEKPGSEKEASWFTRLFRNTSEDRQTVVARRVQELSVFIKENFNAIQDHVAQQ